MHLSQSKDSKKNVNMDLFTSSLITGWSLLSVMCEQRKTKYEPLYSYLGFYYIFMLIDNMYIAGDFYYLEFQVSSKERG